MWSFGLLWLLFVQPYNSSRCGLVMTLKEDIVATVVREYLPVLALLGLLNILPLFFKVLVITFERRKLQSEVDISVVRRFFYYQMAKRIFALMSGSMSKGLEKMLLDPMSMFGDFSDSVGNQAAFSSIFLSLRCMSPLWLLRTASVSRGWVTPRAAFQQRYHQCHTAGHTEANIIGCLPTGSFVH